MNDNEYEDPYAPDEEYGSETTEYVEERKWEDIKYPQEETDQEEEHFQYPPIEMETPVYEPEPSRTEDADTEGVAYEEDGAETVEYEEEEEWEEAPYPQEEVAYEEEAVYEEEQAAYGEEEITEQEVAAQEETPYEEEPVVQVATPYEEEAVYEEEQAAYGEEVITEQEVAAQEQAPYEEAGVQTAEPPMEEAPYEEQVSQDQFPYQQEVTPYQEEADYHEEAVYEEEQAAYGEEEITEQEVAAQEQAPYEEAGVQTAEPPMEEAPYEEQVSQDQFPYQQEATPYQEQKPEKVEELPYYPPIGAQAPIPEPEVIEREAAFTGDAVVADTAAPATKYHRDEFWDDIDNPKGEKWRERFGGLRRRRAREKVPFYDEEPEEHEAEDINEATVATYAEEATESAQEEAVVAQATADKRTLESHEIARPKVQLVSGAVKKLQSAEERSPLKMQIPEDYEGETTITPRYFRAVLFAIITGLLGAGLYATITWWKHREYGIFCWVIGIAVGLAVVYGSGKHYNWILGTISASVSIIAMCIGRILTYMMDIWFPDIIKIPVGTWDNFHNATTMFFQELLSVWLVFLLMAGIVAFLISFRPLPLTLKSSQERAINR